MPPPAPASNAQTGAPQQGNGVKAAVITAGNATENILKSFSLVAAVAPLVPLPPLLRTEVLPAILPSVASMLWKRGKDNNPNPVRIEPSPTGFALVFGNFLKFAPFVPILSYQAYRVQHPRTKGQVESINKAWGRLCAKNPIMAAMGNLPVAQTSSRVLAQVLSAVSGALLNLAYQDKVRGAKIQLASPEGDARLDHAVSKPNTTVGDLARVAVIFASAGLLNLPAIRSHVGKAVFGEKGSEIARAMAGEVAHVSALVMAAVVSCSVDEHLKNAPPPDSAESDAPLVAPIWD
jgi:hypothetical protein